MRRRRDCGVEHCGSSGLCLGVPWSLAHPGSPQRRNVGGYRFAAPLLHPCTSMGHGKVVHGSALVWKCIKKFQSITVTSASQKNIALIFGLARARLPACCDCSSQGVRVVCGLMLIAAGGGSAGRKPFMCRASREWCKGTRTADQPSRRARRDSVQHERQCDDRPPYKWLLRQSGARHGSTRYNSEAENKI